jgi:hypothetical protein
MIPGFINRGPQVGEMEISDFELRCGFPLPLDYREFLRRQNGGHRTSKSEIEDARNTPEEAKELIPPKNLFLSLGLASAIGYSINDVPQLVSTGLIADEPDLLRDLDVALNLCRLLDCPANLLPIAKVNYGENHLLLSLDGPEAGEVRFLYDPDGYCEWHCESIARSFTDLLNGYDQWEHA